MNRFVHVLVGDCDSARLATALEFLRERFYIIGHQAFERRCRLIG